MKRAKNCLGTELHLNVIHAKTCRSTLHKSYFERHIVISNTKHGYKMTNS